MTLSASCMTLVREAVTRAYLEPKLIHSVRRSDSTISKLCAFFLFRRTWALECLLADSDYLRADGALLQIVLSCQALPIFELGISRELDRYHPKCLYVKLNTGVYL